MYDGSKEGSGCRSSLRRMTTTLCLYDGVSHVKLRFRSAKKLKTEIPKMQQFKKNKSLNLCYRKIESAFV